MTPTGAAGALQVGVTVTVLWVVVELVIVVVVFSVFERQGRLAQVSQKEGAEAMSIVNVSDVAVWPLYLSFTFGIVMVEVIVVGSP